VVWRGLRCHAVCDDVTELSAGVSGTIEYPASGVYAANMNCRWRLHAPAGMVSTASSSPYHFLQIPGSWAFTKITRASALTRRHKPQPQKDNRRRKAGVRERDAGIQLARGRFWRNYYGNVCLCYHFPTNFSLMSIHDTTSICFNDGRDDMSPSLCTESIAAYTYTKLESLLKFWNPCFFGVATKEVILRSVCTYMYCLLQFFDIGVHTRAGGACPRILASLWV